MDDSATTNETIAPVVPATSLGLFSALTPSNASC